MRFCNNCKRLAPGKDPFCSRCGCTYDVKLCPRQHINPRAAMLCSQCGSRDLSTPQPKLPVFLRLIRALHLGSLLLLCLLVYVVFYVFQLLTDPNNLLPLMCLGFTLGLLFYLWAKLPKPVKNGVRKIGKIVGRKRSDNGAKR
jgi:hypothetical protein